MIEDTIDKEENCDYNKDDHDPPTSHHAIDIFIGANNTIL